MTGSVFQSLSQPRAPRRRAHEIERPLRFHHHRAARDQHAQHDLPLHPLRPRQLLEQREAHEPAGDFVNGGDAAHRKDGRRCRLHHGRRIGRNKVRHRASPNTTLASRSGKYSALLSMRESELHTRAHERVNNYKMIPLFLRAAALPPLPQHGSATLASIRQHGRAAGVHPCSPARPAKGETSPRRQKPIPRGEEA